MGRFLDSRGLLPGVAAVGHLAVGSEKKRERVCPATTGVVAGSRFYRGSPVEGDLEPTAAATAAATTGTRTLLRLVDHQRAAIHLVAVERRDGLRHTAVVDLHEAEATGTTGLAVGNEGH